ncbi:hypothetical protein HID58_041129 [Brassica napus]|uniref:Uncharacterized protein n=4 Tax=Brassica TaxID=3705 RepID=A0ABQ8BBK5_BRANA|nr:hypothetical protein HID58_041129 [Brassica napus]CDY61680.1 BnaC01g40970D [Brassica napus]VDD48896.1 unnamed protein product [Brassica oleracea]
MGITLLLQIKPPCPMTDITAEGWTMDGHYRSLIYMRPLAIRGMQWALSLQKAILDTPKINMMARVHMSPMSRIFSHNSKVSSEFFFSLHGNEAYPLCLSWKQCYFDFIKEEAGRLFRPLQTILWYYLKDHSYTLYNAEI